MPMIEDLSLYLADWGEEATIDGAPAWGIFAAPYSSGPLGDVGMSSAVPRYLMQTAAVPDGLQAALTPQDDDPVLELAMPRAGVFRFIVREVQPDGTGMTTLMLEQAPSQAA